MVGWEVSFLKQILVSYLVVRAEEVEDIFSEHNLVNPFNLKKSIKQMMKDYNIINENELYHNLSLELRSAFCNISDKNSIYFSTINRKVGIMKIRMIDEASNSGKSKGYRIVGLFDGINNIFYLLEMYKHSKGKDDLTPKESKALRKLCDDYADSL